MISYTSFNRILFLVPLLCLNGFDNRFRCFLNRFITADPLLYLLHQILEAIITTLLIFILQVLNCSHRRTGFLGFGDLLVSLLLKLMISYGVITIHSAYHSVCCFVDFPFQLILCGLTQILPVLFPSCIHEGICNRFTESIS